jgi:hypothetical protein
LHLSDDPYSALHDIAILVALPGAWARRVVHHALHREEAGLSSKSTGERMAYGRVGHDTLRTQIKLLFMAEMTPFTYGDAVRIIDGERPRHGPNQPNALFYWATIGA